MDELHWKVIRFSREFFLFSDSDVVVIGVSGGADSVFLLHILLQLQNILSIKKFFCAHFNHLTRGEESLRDEEFVKKTCEDLKVDFICERAKNSPRNEDEARKLRYAFLKESAEKIGATKVATAHNLDDQMETFLLRLIRGTGVSGAVGIKPFNTEICKPIPVVRPLLMITKDEIRTYLRTKEISWVEDSSNYDPKIQRNKIRKFIESSPDKEKLLKGFYKFWLSLYDVNKFIENTFTFDGNEFDLKEIEKYSNSRSRLIASRALLSRALLNKFTLPSEDIVKKFANFIFSEKKKNAIFRTGDITVTREYGKLLFNSEGESNIEKSIVIIDGFGNREFTFSKKRYNLTITRTKMKSKEKLSAKGNLVHISGDKLTFPINIRQWRYGDRFSPFGLSGTKKIQDYFQDQKIPLLRRTSIPIFESAGRIMWVLGGRIDNYFAVNDLENVVEFDCRIVEN